MTNRVVALYVNSNNRDEGGTNEDFTITDSSNRYAIQPTQVKLTRAQIPYTWYNITVLNNNIGIQEPPNSVITVQIEPGNYNATTLAYAIQTAISNSDLNYTYTILFNGATGSYIFAATGSFELNFTMENNMATRLGFVSGDIYGPDTSITAPNPAQILDDYEIWICSDLVSGIDNGYGVLVSGAASNSQILGIVNINTCPGSNNTYCCQTEEPWFPISQSYWGNVYTINETVDRPITFSLQFPSGNAIDLNGYAWTCILTFK
jgi:hypothetical protein